MSSSHLRLVITTLKQLGWDKAEFADAITLSLGIPGQQRSIKQALDYRPWRIIDIKKEIATQTIGKTPVIDIRLLSIYGLRVGVKPQHTARYLFGTHHNTIAQLISDRGINYAKEFVRHAYNPYVLMEPTTLDATSNVITSVILVHSPLWKDLPIPKHNHYLLMWAFITAAIYGAEEVATINGKADLPTKTALRKRFNEHIQACREARIEIMGPFGFCAATGIRLNLVPRPEPISWIIDALMLATERTHKRFLLKLLTNEIKITDKELLRHRELLKPAITNHDIQIVEEIGHRLLAVIDDQEILEFAQGALDTPTTKAKLLSLQALSERGKLPFTLVLKLRSRLKTLAGHSDDTISQLATNILESWNIAEQDLLPAISTTPKDILWQPTPRLWKAPRFERGPATVDGILDLLPDLTINPAVSDLPTEQLLARIITLASTDTEAARRAIADDALVFRDRGLIQGKSIALMREREAILRLGSIPCLLSEPSYVDLSISASDIVQRLERYHEVGAAVLPFDLYLAMLRLDVNDLDYGMLKQRLAKLKVPLARLSFIRQDHNVPDIVLSFIDDPFPEHYLRQYRHLDNRWVPHWNMSVQSLLYCPFPREPWTSHYGEFDPGMLPRGEDEVWISMRWSQIANAEHVTKLAKQAAYRSRPFGPGLAMNMLAIQRPRRSGIFEDVWLALLQSWDRGLLRPGVADPKWLDWKIEVDTYTGLPETLVKIAREGLLSVVWPVLDAMLVASHRNYRRIIGSHEVSQAMLELAPEITRAIEAGAAPKSAAKPPGLGLFAIKKQGRVYAIAREAAAKLPDVDHKRMLFDDC
jgi:hypothetical protein